MDHTLSPSVSPKPAFSAWLMPTSARDFATLAALVSLADTTKERPLDPRDLDPDNVPCTD